jgi:hypothetical protein
MKEAFRTAVVGIVENDISAFLTKFNSRPKISTLYGQFQRELSGDNSDTVCLTSDTMYMEK